MSDLEALLRRLRPLGSLTPCAILRDGKPWFVAKDVCECLALRTNNLRAVLEADEIATAKGYGVDICQPGRSPLLINESGLYALIFKSVKAEAARFRKWVDSEVLPTIRKTGMYLTPAVAEQAVEDTDRRPPSPMFHTPSIDRLMMTPRTLNDDAARQAAMLYPENPAARVAYLRGFEQGRQSDRSARVPALLRSPQGSCFERSGYARS